MYVHKYLGVGSEGEGKSRSSCRPLIHLRCGCPQLVCFVFGSGKRAREGMWRMSVSQLMRQLISLCPVEGGGGQTEGKAGAAVAHAIPRALSMS